MREIFFTKEEAWLEKWDQFVYDHPQGSHLILSDWLKSYTSYGFEYEIGLVLQGDKIIAGCGVIIPKFMVFKFYIIPHGPIFLEEYNNDLKEFLVEIKNNAQRIGSCYMQLSLPISSNKKIEKLTYDMTIANSWKEINLKSGKLFKFVYSAYGLNWVDLKNYEDAEAYLEQLTPKVRRNIRMPYNKLATAKFLTELDDIEKAYEIITENASYGGYSVRSFKEFKTTIIELISKNKGFFISCEVDGQIKAAGFFVNTSGYITNIMGGVSREKPDIKLGYMLQWEIIKKSFELGFSGYNISMGGSKGVQEFKSKFGAESIYYHEPHYYLIINRFWFNIYTTIEKKIKPLKKTVSKILFFISK